MKLMDIINAVERAGPNANGHAPEGHTAGCEWIASFAMDELAQKFGGDTRECWYTKKAIRQVMDMLREFDGVSW